MRRFSFFRWAMNVFLLVVPVALLQSPVSPDMPMSKTWYFITLTQVRGALRMWKQKKKTRRRRTRREHDGYVSSHRRRYLYYYYFPFVTSCEFIIKRACVCARAYALLLNIYIYRKRERKRDRKIRWCLKPQTHGRRDDGFPSTQ